MADSLNQAWWLERWHPVKAAKAKRDKGDGGICKPKFGGVSFAHTG